MSHYRGRDRVKSTTTTEAELIMCPACGSRITGRLTFEATYWVTRPRDLLALHGLGDRPGGLVDPETGEIVDEAGGGDDE